MKSLHTWAWVGCIGLNGLACLAEDDVAQRARFEASLYEMRVPELRLKAASVQQAVAELAKRGVNIREELPDGFEGPTLSVDLTDVPMMEAVLYTFEAAGLVVELRPPGLVVRAPDSPTATFAIPPDFVSMGTTPVIRAYAPSSSSSTALGAKGRMFPAGTKVRHFPRTSQIMVQGSTEAIETARVFFLNLKPSVPVSRSFCAADFLIQPRDAPVVVTSPGQLLKRVYALPKQAFRGDPKQHLVEQGISFGKEATVQVDVRTNTLTVLNTHPNLELTEIYLISLWDHAQDIPPFVGKPKCYEMPLWLGGDE